MAKPSFGCGRSECSSSTCVGEWTTFGEGKLSPNGFWEFPCDVCESAWRKHLMNDSQARSLLPGDYEAYVLEEE